MDSGEKNMSISSIKKFTSGGEVGGSFVVVVVVVVLVFQDRVSLSSFGACPRTRSVDQAGLELTEIHLPLPLPPKCWD